MQLVRPIACPNSGFVVQLRVFEQREAERRGKRVYQTRAAVACSRQADDGDTAMCCAGAVPPGGGATAAAAGGGAEISNSSGKER